MIDDFFTKKDNERKKLSSVLSSLESSSYGCRFEVTCLNTGKAGLVNVYEYLSKVANNIVRTHNSLVKMFQNREIPLESLRFSQIQRVTTTSLMKIVRLQTQQMYDAFEALFKFAAQSKYQNLIEFPFFNLILMLKNRILDNGNYSPCGYKCVGNT